MLLISILDLSYLLSSNISGDNGIVAESSEIHFRTLDGETSFRIAGDKAELRAKKFKSLSEKRKFLNVMTQNVIYRMICQIED